MKDVDFIRNYFSDNLTDKERLDFEQKCIQDEHFANEVAIYLKLEETLISNKKIEEVEKLKEDNYRKLKKRKILPMIVQIAASIILLIGLWFVYQKGELAKPSIAEQLSQEYKNNFTPYPNRFTSDNRDYLEQTPTILEKVMREYDTDEYESALEGLQKIKTQIKKPDTLNFIRLYEGNALLKLGKPNEAVTTFRQIIESPEETCKEYAYWYLGLSYLETGELQFAIENLKIKTTKYNDFNHDKAVALLNRLRQLSSQEKNTQ